MMIKKADIVIIGGGVVGCSIAYNLAKLGAKNIILLEYNCIRRAKRVENFFFYWGG